jgi:hypothetical protein
MIGRHDGSAARAPGSGTSAGSVRHSRRRTAARDVPASASCAAFRSRHRELEHLAARLDTGMRLGQTACRDCTGGAGSTRRGRVA